jgi:hypothetical protein
MKVRKNNILLLVLYACKTWSLTLGERVIRRIQNVTVLKNRVIRRMFTTERETVREALAKLQN